MKIESEIVISGTKRTPFAQISKGLGSYESHHLGLLTAKKVIEESKIEKNDIDGVVAGEASASQPNPARVISNLLKLPNEIPALTVSNNCASSMEAVAETCRRIELKEGKLYLAIGQESLTCMPVVIKGARNHKETANLEKLKNHLPNDLPEGVTMSDVLEDGLNGSENSYGMHVTAEIVAQNYGISREKSDKLAYHSFKRAYDATLAGKYRQFLIPVESSDSGKELQDDEAVLLRKGIVENPSRMQKAMLLFDNRVMKFDEFTKQYASSLEKSHGPTVSIFNASPRSDGASATFVSTKERAQDLGLTPLARITGFRMKGVDPNQMGIGQAEASLSLLEDLGINIEQVDQIEIHEAFAATVLGALEELQKRAGYKWESKLEEGKINPNGGSIAIGHPFGATGIRLLANAAMSFQNDSSVNRILVTACAHGGVAGSMMLERA